MDRFSPAKRFFCLFAVLFLYAFMPGIPGNGWLPEATAGSDETRKYVDASSDNFPPMNLLNEDGQITGFGPELADAVIKAVGGEITHIHSSIWVEVLEWLNTGKADFIHDTGYTEERDRFLDYSDPIMEMPEVIFVRSNQYDISNIDSLEGKTVACVRQHITHLYLKHFPGIICYEVKTPVEGLYELVSGKVDAFVYPEQIVLYLAQTLRLSDKIKTTGDPLRTLTWSMVVKEGNSELLALLNRGIKEVRESGEYDRIYKKWWGKRILGGYSKSELQWITGITSGCLLLLTLTITLFFFNRKLTKRKKDLEREVKEREKAEQEARESGKKFKQIFDHSFIGKSITLPSGEMQANKAFCNMLGYSKEEFQGLKWQEISHPDDVASSQKIVDAILGGEKDSARFVKRYIHKNGSVVWADVSTTLSRDDAGSPLYLMTTAADITSQKLGEEMLRESEERLKIAGKAAYDLIYEWDVHSDTLEWFGDIDGLLGYEPGTISRNIGAWIERIHPEDKGQLENAVELHRREVRLIHYEYRIKHRDGSYRYWQDHGLPILDAQGHPARWIGVCTDITDRKRAEEALRESEWLFSQTFEQSTTSMCLYKPDGTILKINHEFSKMFGVEEKKIIDSGYNVFKDQAAMDAGIIPLLKEIFHEKKSRTWKIDFDIAVASDSTGTPTSRPEKIFIEVFGYPVVNRKGELEFVVLQHYDMTDRRRAEEEKKKLTFQLQQSQKMEAVGTLAGGIAHEFNNVLAIILGNAELAMDDIPEWNPAKESLGEIRTASIRAKEVVRQILSFARKTMTALKPLDINTIVKESLKLMRASIPAMIDIQSDIPPEPKMILGDPTEIHQIIINLCTNAAHAMKETGGVLEVRVSEVTLDEETASRYEDLSPGDFVKLTVEDSGEGISPDVTKKVFEPYFTTKEFGAGSGMGLAVVYGIVKKCKGDITIDSTVGKGTTVEVLFSEIKEEAPAEVPKESRLPMGDERILLVDDDSSIVNMIRLMLERFGYTVSAMTDSAKALAIFQTNPDGFDLVITDMSMPKMSGTQLAGELIEVRKDIPILLCTGHSDIVDEKKARAMGIKGFAMKPLDKSELAKAVRAALDKNAERI